MLQLLRVDWSRGTDEEAPPAKAPRNPDGEDRPARARRAPAKPRGGASARPLADGAEARAGADLERCRRSRPVRRGDLLHPADPDLQAPDRRRVSALGPDVPALHPVGPRD